MKSMLSNGWLFMVDLLLRSISFLLGKYDTSDCPVNVMEYRTFHSFIERTPITARDTMKLIATGNKAKNDKGLIDTIKVNFYAIIVCTKLFPTSYPMPKNVVHKS